MSPYTLAALVEYNKSTRAPAACVKFPKSTEGRATKFRFPTITHPVYLKPRKTIHSLRHCILRVMYFVSYV